MCARTSLNEKRILTLSALLASGFAGGGLVLGLLVGSLVIMFDGVYSMVSLLLTLLSLAASRYMRKPSQGQFQYGKAMLEPIVIMIKGAVILSVVSYSLSSAISALFTGGREVDASIATLFGVVNVLGCGYAWWLIANSSKRFSSGLIEAEAKQWKMDTLLSVAVTAGFVSAWLLSISPWAEYDVYADPMMMVLMSFYFIKVPFDMIKGAARELLMMRPSKEICQLVDTEIAALDEQSPQHFKLAGVTKIGQELRVKIDIHSTSQQLDVKHLDRVRRVLKDKLSTLSLDLNLTLNIAN